MYLTLLDFIKRFTIDTLGSGWAGLQSMDADFDTAGLAISVVVPIDEFKCIVNFTDEFSFSIPGL